MFRQRVSIDQVGRILLPKQILDALGVEPESEVILELNEKSVSIKPQQSVTPITHRLADMNLPIADWEQMESEIDAGRSQIFV